MAMSPVRVFGLPFVRSSALLAGLLLVSPRANAQTKADYERALGLRDKYQYLTVNVPDGATWVGKSSRFHQRRPFVDAAGREGAA